MIGDSEKSITMYYIISR